MSYQCFDCKHKFDNPKEMGEESSEASVCPECLSDRYHETAEPVDYFEWFINKLTHRLESTRTLNEMVRNSGLSEHTESDLPSRAEKSFNQYQSK